MQASVVDDLKDKLASTKGRVFVDFDYTLYRSNSTEDFLNCGRPALVAALVLRFLAAFRPWAIGPKRNSNFVWRDVVRIFSILFFLPWTILIFRRNARILFEKNRNKELIEVLKEVDPARIVIVSAGYRLFISQLLAGSQFEKTQLIASPLFGNLDLRKRGKLNALQKLGLVPDEEQDIVITDSLDDEDLINSVQHGFLIESDNYEEARLLQGVYVPFFYSARVKRSTEFVVKQIFLEELFVVLLATAFFLPFAVATWLSVVALFVAFLTAYEIGYAENDRIGYMREKEPKLAQDYERFKGFELEPGAWVWVVCLTVVGITILDIAHVTAALDRLGLLSSQSDPLNRVLLGVFWLGVVFVGRMVFYVYNRLAMVWRIFCYVLLHFVKYFGLILIFPSHPVGYALLSAQIVRTWSLYAIRRCGGDMEKIASQTVRLSFFLMFLTAIELATTMQLYNDWAYLGCVGVVHSAGRTGSETKVI